MLRHSALAVGCQPSRQPRAAYRIEAGARRMNVTDTPFKHRRELRCGGSARGCRPQGCGRQAYREVFTASRGAGHHIEAGHTRMNAKDQRSPDAVGFGATPRHAGVGRRDAAVKPTGKYSRRPAGRGAAPKPGTHAWTPL